MRKGAFNAGVSFVLVYLSFALLRLGSVYLGVLESCLAAINIGIAYHYLTKDTK